jgi:hypothetical protein
MLRADTNDTLEYKPTGIPAHWKPRWTPKNLVREAWAVILSRPKPGALSGGIAG